MFDSILGDLKNVGADNLLNCNLIRCYFAVIFSDTDYDFELQYSEVDVQFDSSSFQSIQPFHFGRRRCHTWHTCQFRTSVMYYTTAGGAET